MENRAAEFLRILGKPNGPEALAGAPFAAEAVTVLADHVFSEEIEAKDLSGILSFLSQMAKTKIYRRELARSLPAEALSGLLSSSTPKVRRNAARLMGAMAKAFEEGALAKEEATSSRRTLVQALEEALGAEEVRMLRPAYLLALGNYRDEPFLEAYEVEAPKTVEEEKHYHEEVKALSLALEKSGGAKKKTAAVGFAAKGSFDAIFRCSRGFEEEMKASLTALLKERQKEPVRLKADPWGPGALVAEGLEAADVKALHEKERIHLEMLFLAGEGSLDEVIEAALSFCQTKLLCEEALPFRLEIAPRSLQRYLESKEKQIEARDRRGFLQKTAALLEEKSTGYLINSVSRYALEVRLENMEKKGMLWWRAAVKPFFLGDARFFYRQEAIPASIHPANAAGVAALVRSYRSQPSQEELRVLDPCCGSGTLLFERALLEEALMEKASLQRPARLSLYGFDIEQRAIRAAKANEKAFETQGQKGMRIRKRFRFAIADLETLSFEKPFDEIYANLPFGNRVGSHQDNQRLYQALIRRLPQWLLPEGIACLYTMEGSLLEGLIRQEPALEFLEVRRVFAGGLEPKAYLLRRAAAH